MQKMFTHNMRTFISWLFCPLVKDFQWFLSILFVLTIPQIVYRSQEIATNYTIAGAISISLYTLSLGIIITTFLMFFYGRNRFINNVIWIIIGLSAIIDIFCYGNLRAEYCKTFYNIFLNTTTSEAGEFLQANFRLGFLIYFIITIVGGVLGYFLGIYIKIRFKTFLRIRYIALFLMFDLICSIALVYKFKDYNVLHSSEIPLKAWTIIHSGKYPRLAPKAIEIKEINPNRPKYVICIIGESMQRDNCSTYGYDKCTQPLLEALANADSLVVFSNPISPSANTIDFFQHFIGLYDDNCKSEWWEYPTIFDLCRAQNYKSFWFSNQNQSDVLDGPIMNIAHCSDVAQWVADNDKSNNSAGRTTSKNLLDSQLLPLIDNLIENTVSDSIEIFSIIHLLGSHTMYSQRYPSEYECFKPEDYSYLKENQRKKISQYDNSILYNDWVVNELIHKFANEEAVILYFSDHGQDIYYTFDDYCGHAILGNQKSFDKATQIPFYVYMSSKYQENFPEEVKFIESIKDEEFNTTNTIYLIARLMGCEIKE